MSELEERAYKAFAKYVSSDDMEGWLAEEIADLYETLTSLPHDEAIALAREIAADKVAQITEATRQGLSKTIADAVAQGKSPDQIQDAISNSNLIGLDAQRQARLETFKKDLEEQGLSPKAIDKLAQKEAQRLLEERAGVIAQQELREAMAGGNEAVAKARGATHKQSITAGDGRVAPECLENEAAGVIPINEPFPSGHMREPFHVACRCSVAFFTEPDEDYINELNEEAKAKTERLTNATN